MTIEIRGHVQSLDHAGAGHVLLRVQIEASRMPARALGHPPIVEIYASSDEIAMYRPGTPIRIQVRPDATPDREAEHGS